MKGRDESTPAKPNTSHFENPADAEASKALADGLAAGADVFGDMDDDPEPASVASGDSGGANEGADAGNANDDTGGADDDLDVDAGAKSAPLTTEAQQATLPPAAAEAPPAASNPQPQPQPQYKTKSLDDLAAAQKALFAEKAEAFDQYSTGTMTAAEYSAVDSRVMTSLVSLASETALANANAQAAMQASEAALESIKALAKEQGLIDYADQATAGQFDDAVVMLAKNPKMAQLSNADFFAKAHDMVLMMNGHATSGRTSAPVATAPTGKPPARQDSTGPITLRALPTAATPNTNGGVAEQLGRLSGLDFEDAVGSMGRAQRDAWLDS